MKNKKIILFIPVLIILVGLVIFSFIKKDHSSQAAQALAKLPVSFIENRGQIKGDYHFYAQGSGYRFLFSPQGITYAFAHDKTPIQLSFPGANPQPIISGGQKLEGKINYLRGKDQSQWKTNLSTYGEVTYKDLYPGIDYVVLGKKQGLELEFHIKPEANPNQIRMAYTEGVEQLEISQVGDLVIKTKGGDLIEKKPYVYQEIKGKRIEIASRYWTQGKEYGFYLGSYDPQYNIVIDPTLIYSTYLGGSYYEYDFSITVDGDGNALVTGYTESSDFPLLNAFQPSFGGEKDVFVTKIASDGTVVYSTYLGGSGYEYDSSITVDGDGNALVTGSTSSSDFPLLNAFQPSNSGETDVFVTKIASDGTVVYSTYLGGSGYEYGYSITVDGDGNALVTGLTYSSDFPLLNAFQPSISGEEDVFVTKIASDGTGVYSTYLGGSGSEYGYSITVDGDGNALVTGYTYSSDFPLLNAFQPSISGEADIFVTKICFSSVCIPEVCNGIDDDGDGVIDEGFPDTDGDGIADCVEVETCDGLDNNGNGITDEADCFDLNFDLRTALLTEDDVLTLHYTIDNFSPIAQYTNIIFLIWEFGQPTPVLHPVDVGPVGVPAAGGISGLASLNLSGYVNPWTLNLVVGVLYNNEDAITETTWIDYYWQPFFVFP